jgi:hypothetical protein
MDNTVSKILLLTESSENGVCIACFDETHCIVDCCRAPICRTCYLEWLKRKRQCMHCKADQCSFQEWIDHYRTEEEFNPHQYLHQLLQTENTELVESFELAGYMEAVARTLGDMAGYSLMFDPTMPSIDEDFAFEFGYIATPLDQDGNPAGPGVVVTQTLDYPGASGEVPVDMYNQIQEAMEQFQMLYEQGSAPSNDGDETPQVQLPELPPDCTQQ